MQLFASSSAISNTVMVDPADADMPLMNVGRFCLTWTDFVAPCSSGQAVPVQTKQQQENNSSSNGSS
jgi:hypothetical protein